jgi:hypothetical protein
MNKLSLSGSRSASPPPLFQLTRRLVAAVLCSVTSLLAAKRRHSERAACLPEVEFHALHSEAGAPEGALYVDGKFVGVLPVNRL